VQDGEIQHHSLYIERGSISGRIGTVYLRDTESDEAGKQCPANHGAPCNSELIATFLTSYSSLIHSQ